MAHADEFETSLYLHLAPDRVRMDRAVADNDVVGKYMSSDSTSPFVRFTDYWGRWTKSGVHGDPTAATAEKGKIIWEAVLVPLAGVGRRVARAGRSPRAATSTGDPFSHTFSGETMKIREIRAAGLRGATPEGGWDEELRPDDCVHTLDRRDHRRGPDRAGQRCSPASRWCARPWLCWSRCIAARTPWSRSG